MPLWERHLLLDHLKSEFEEEDGQSSSKPVGDPFSSVPKDLQGLNG